MSNGYPDEWPEARELAKERDSNTCQDCGDESSPVEVHHKDGDKENSDLSNLITLCKDCHDDRHRKERVEIGKQSRSGWGPTTEYRGVVDRERSEDMREVDWNIVEILREGRNNAPNISERLGLSRQYIAERLGHLKTGDVVVAIGNGIYELVPEEVPEREETNDDE